MVTLASVLYVSCTKTKNFQFIYGYLSLEHLHVRKGKNKQNRQKRYISLFIFNP